MKLVLPSKLFDAAMYRVDKTKRVMTSSITLKIFWKIVLAPIDLIVSLLVSVLKMPIIWLMPRSIPSMLSYSLRMFHSDITSSKDRLPVKVALKRVKLFIELSIKGRERKVSFGKKNPNKTFYVIRPYYFVEKNELTVRQSNLFFHYYRNLQHLAYAVDKGWIPVVDWKNYGNFSHGEDFPVNGTTNCWEYFWNQPSEYSLDEVYDSKNVILGLQNTRDIHLIPSCFFKTPLRKQALTYMQKCPAYDKYITLNTPTASYVNKWYEILFPKSAKILGVSVRATSYGTTRVPGHPKQPTFGELLIAVDKSLIDWNMDYVFFACESEDLVNSMFEKYGEKLILLPRSRYTVYKGSGGEHNPLYQPGQRYQTNLDYLTEMYLLSRCNALVCGMSGGVRIAIIWNNCAYERIRVMDRGLWK